MGGSHERDSDAGTAGTLPLIIEDDQTRFEYGVYMLTDGAAEVLIRKHKDYGPTNISRSPGGPLNGLRVRIWDKIARINNLIETGAAPEHESLRDSFLDLMCYSAIAMMVLDGTWPDE